MVSATTVVGIDVSREWLDGFCLPDLQRFCLANSPEAHENLILMIRQMPAPLRVGFEATGRQEWAVWTALATAGIDARQLPRAQIKAFAKSRGTRAKHIGSMRSSLPASCCSGLRQDGGCQVITCVFSEP